ncbi:MAG TPA: ORF6N domain-containing protein [Armatimonadota bacterium]|nr:ORF6N domain-containing protein [Armatimonadota bacterium]
MTEHVLVPVDAISATILTIRGQRVILDRDLARLYGISTMRLNEQVKRNRERFPEDFMFQLTEAEKAEVIAICDNLSRLKFSPSLPYAFTEHGAVMAASILNTPTAVEVSVYVVRAFVQQRAMLAAHGEMALKLERLERKLLASLQLIHEHDDRLDTVERHIEALLEAVRALMAPPTASRRRIGFRVDDETDG